MNHHGIFGLKRMQVLLLILALLVLLPAVASAATTTIRPDGVVSAGSWTGVTAANLSDASDLTAASITGSVSTFTVSLANDPAYVGATISDVTVWVRAQALGGSGGPEKFDFGQSGGTMSTGNAATRGAWGNASLSLGALTDAQVNALNIDVVSSTIGGGETIEIADIWVVVTYTVPCSDPDPPTLTISEPTESATISGTYRVKLQITGELNPETFTSVEFSLKGGGYVPATGWDGTNWYYDWDTALEVDGAATIDARGNDPDCGTQVAAPQRNVTISNSGPANTLTSCAGCHDYPPADGSTRNNPEGAVVGDHQKHNAYTCNFCHVVPATETSADFAHRDGDINMKAGTIGDAASGDNGAYSRGATFAQSNSPTTGTCSNVDCHNNSVTPQWGVGTTDCASCHSAPPATGAHDAHYTAKGWTSPDTAGANCATCHPGDHDGLVEVNASLTPGGASPAITCASTPAGCHNGNTSPAWNVVPGTIVCTNCHTVGGANTGSLANPVSGLHNLTAAGTTAHDDAFGVGGNCESCHAKASIAGHWDGANGGDPPNYTSAQVGISIATGSYTDDGGTGASRGTCTTTCHNDAGNWSRQWSTAANSTATTTGDPRCDVCHGQFGNWRAGTSHGATFGGSASTRGSGHNSLGGAANACEDCHIYVTDGATYHRNGVLTMNNAGGIVELGSPSFRAYCGACHTNDGDYAVSGTHTFKRTVFFPAEEISGPNDPVGSCTNCHGGGTAGASADNYWPDGSTAHTANQAGKHVKHMTVLAGRVYGLTLQGLLDDASSDTKQKALCEYCHAANTNDSDHSNTYPADVFVDADAVRHAKNLWGLADADAAYDNVADTCSNVDCHNGKLTTDGTYGWYDAGTSTCTLCHTPGGGGSNPGSGLHNGSTPTISGKKHDDTLSTGCTVCHTSLPTSSGQTSTHINGTFTGNGSLAGDRTNMGLFAAYTSSGTDNTGSCSGALVGGASCHAGAGDAGSWARKWDSSIHFASTGAECAGCHGGMTGSGSWNTGVLNHFQNWDGDGNTNEVPTNHGSDDNTAASRTTKCSKCHVYADTVNSTYTNNGNNSIGWVANASSTSTYHGNGKIDFDANRSYTTAGGCASSCHQDNTNHKMTASGWTLNNVSGAPELACTDCHTGTGTQQFKVGASSSHTDPDGGGATYAAGANNCAVCHFASHATRTTGTIGANWDTRTMGTDYTADGKIYLKKLAGTESYEAEICWNCHWGANMPSISPLIKEFGGTQGAYQTGTLSQRNWYGATWTSANFAYKTNTVASIHQAMSSTAVDPTIDTALGATDVGTIGCTSCHDVHQVGNNGFTPAGQPYLRGSWTSNPFKEDGAPQNGQTMSSDRGAVPRGIGSKAANGIGGWQIEQNNASFTNTVYSGASGFAGLCANCHTQGTLETKWSGHQGAVSGFTGGTGNNFLNPTARGNPTGDYTKGHMSYNNYQGTGRNGGTWVGGLRNARQWNDGIAPADIDSLQTTGTNITYPAGAVTTILSGPADAPQDNFHNFPCSKCHSPHASRLQRLMITNCLDVRHNTWDDPANGNAGNPSSWAPGAQTATELAYSTTAQNCHRYTGAGTGWNTITPW